MTSKNFENFQISKANLEGFMVKISSDLKHSSYVNFINPKTWKSFNGGNPKPNQSFSN